MQMPGEALLAKLWETIADKGIGSLLRPWQIRREGLAQIDVRRTELLALAQTELDATAIRRGEKTLTAENKLLNSTQQAPLVITNEPTQAQMSPLLIDISTRNITADALQREVRLARAVLHAEEELVADEAIPGEESVSDDWLYRWRECAAGVSAEQLQAAWGSVLAGEIKSPGRFSLRTLDFLRNLSQPEAKLIEQISPFVLADMVFRGDQQALVAAGIRESELLKLQELGVLTGVDGLGLEVSFVSNSTDAYSQVLTSHGRVLLVTAAESSKLLKLAAFPLTGVGRQVLQLGRFQANDAYLRNVGDAIKPQGFAVRLASFKPIGNNRIRCFEAHEL